MDSSPPRHSLRSSISSLFRHSNANRVHGPQDIRRQQEVDIIGREIQVIKRAIDWHEARAECDAPSLRESFRNLVRQHEQAFSPISLGSESVSATADRDTSPLQPDRTATVASRHLRLRRRPRISFRGLAETGRESRFANLLPNSIRNSHRYREALEDASPYRADHLRRALEQFSDASFHRDAVRRGIYDGMFADILESVRRTDIRVPAAQVGDRDPLATFSRQISARSISIFPSLAGGDRDALYHEIHYEQEERPLVNVGELGLGSAPITHIAATVRPRRSSMMSRASDHLRTFASFSPLDTVASVSHRTQLGRRLSSLWPLDRRSRDSSVPTRGSFSPINDVATPTTRSNSTADYFDPSLRTSSLEPSTQSQSDLSRRSSDSSNSVLSTPGDFLLSPEATSSQLPQRLSLRRLDFTDPLFAHPGSYNRLNLDANRRYSSDEIRLLTNPTARPGLSSDNSVEGQVTHYELESGYIDETGVVNTLQHGIHRENRSISTSPSPRLSRFVHGGADTHLGRMLDIATSVIAGRHAGNMGDLRIEPIGDDVFVDSVMRSIEDTYPLMDSGLAPELLNAHNMRSDQWHMIRVLRNSDSRSNDVAASPNTNNRPQSLASEPGITTIIIIGFISQQSTGNSSQGVLRRNTDTSRYSNGSLDSPTLRSARASLNVPPRRFSTSLASVESHRRVNGASDMARFPLPYDSQRHHRVEVRHVPATGPIPREAGSPPVGRQARSPNETDDTETNNDSVNGIGGDTGLSHSDNAIEDGSPSNDSAPAPANRRRRSDSEQARRDEILNGSDRRNGIVEPDELPAGNRSWMIYVIGHNLLESHLSVLAPSLFTDNPTNEDMLFLTQLLGEVKPPVASREDVATSAGVFKIANTSSTGMITARSISDGVADIAFERSDRCQVCLTEYEVDEEIRQLDTCKHVYHRACLDEWLTVGRNSCPLCRGAGVKEQGRTSDTVATSPT